MILINRNYNEYFISIVILLIFGSCKKETIELATVNEQDSILITEYFNEADTAAINKDFNQFITQNTLIDANFNTRIFFFNQQSVAFLKSGQFSEAKNLLIDSVLSFEGVKTFQIAKSYNILGNVLFYTKDIEGCINAFHNAAEIFHELNYTKEYGTVQLNLANIFLSQLNFPLVYKYAETSYQILSELNEKGDYLYPLSTSFFAIASLKFENDTERVKSLIQEAIELNQNINHPQVNMLIEYAKAELMTMFNDYTAAIKHFENSIEIAKQIGDQTFISIASTSVVFCHFQLGQHEKVIEKGNEVLEKATLHYFKDILYALHKHLGNSYHELGNHEMAYTHIMEAEKHFREKVNTENQMIVQDLIVKYDSEKKEFKIDQQALALKRGEYLLWSLVGLTSLIIIIFLLYLYIKNRNLKQKMLLSIQEGELKERQRISNELHDGLASDLIGLKMLLEIKNNPKMEQTRLIDLIDKMHAETRKMAHDLAPINFTHKSLSSALNEWITQYDERGKVLSYQSNSNDVYIGHNTSAIVYRIVQEFTQNALKYSNSDKINVSYLRLKNKTKITISDNGIGIESSKMPALVEKIKTLNERMKVFGGIITYVSKENNGTEITLIF